MDLEAEDVFFSRSFIFLGSAKVEKKSAVEEEPAVEILPASRVGSREGEQVGSGGGWLKSGYFNCNKK